jgi:Uma2 family endonuclease
LSEAHDWTWLEGGATAPYMTMEEYLALPEDLARTIEVTDGLIVHCESPSEAHLGIQQNLVSAFQEAIDKHDRDAGGCHRVRMELDILLNDSPSFTFRRPDVIVYRCLPPGERGRWSKPQASDVVVVVEVVSLHSSSSDLLEKRARYAAAGIPSYWIVRMAQNDGPAVSVEILRLTADGAYVSEAVAIRAKSNHAVSVVDPIPIAISWDALDRGIA